MLTRGDLRQQYSDQVERRPSRFLQPAVYRDWAARADAWASAPQPLFDLDEHDNTVRAEALLEAARSGMFAPHDTVTLERLAEQQGARS